MDRLPTEILVKIFRELEYWDLKLGIILVNKRFHSILQDISMSQYMFIDELKLLPTPSPGKLPIDRSKIPEYELHPAFHRLTYSGPDTLDAIRFKEPSSRSVAGSRRYRGQGVGIRRTFWPKSWRLTETSVSDENATSPACQALILHLKFPDEEPQLRQETNVVGRTGTNNRGVTVRDVMQKIVQVCIDRKRRRAARRVSNREGPPTIVDDLWDDYKMVFASGRIGGPWSRGVIRISVSLTPSVDGEEEEFDRFEEFQPAE